MRQILQSNPEHLVLSLATIAGISRALDRASLKSLGDRLPLATVLGVAIVAGALLGIVVLYVFGAILRWTGLWFGGTASAREIRAAVAWPNVLTAWALLLWIPQLLLVGKELFTTEMPTLDANPIVGVWFLGFSVLEIAIFLWFVVVSLKCLAEAQGFSAWMAFGNTAVAMIVIIAPFALLGIVVSLLAS